MPLSMMKESRAIMMPRRARNTQSSPRRANVCLQIHDETFFIRVARLPSSSCKYFPALLLYKPMRSKFTKMSKYSHYLLLINYILAVALFMSMYSEKCLWTTQKERQCHWQWDWDLCQIFANQKWRASVWIRVLCIICAIEHE